MIRAVAVRQEVNLVGDVIYYIVPLEHRHTSEEEQKMMGLDDDLVEIVITDSKEIYEKKNFFEKLMTTFFADNIEKVILFLWQMKCDSENIFIKIPTENADAKYETIEVYSIGQLEKAIKRAYEKGKGYNVIYKDSHIIKKQIINDGCEIFYLYDKSEYLQKNEDILKNWAKKETFSKYELGEE